MDPQVFTRDTSLASLIVKSRGIGVCKVISIPRRDETISRFGAVSAPCSVDLQDWKKFWSVILSNWRSMPSWRFRSAEGVPFTWEMQPGTPKDPPKEEIIPPLSPPPALLGMGLPKPCFDIEEPKTSMRSRFRFWKNIKKNKRNEKPQQGSQGNDIINANDESGKFEVFEFYSSDCDFISSSPQNLSSSSSSSLSRTESASARYSMQEPHSCIPWNFTASVAKRNY